MISGIGIIRVVDTFGPLDIGNAGIRILSPLEAPPLADWHPVLAVHLEAAILLPPRRGGTCTPGP